MTVNNNNIKWDDQYLLGIPLIDRQHERLVRIMNNLQTAACECEELVNLHFIKSTREAAAYLQYHFRTEERLMMLMNYTEFHLHKTEHDNFIQEVLYQFGQFKEGKQTKPAGFVHLLEEWMLSHSAVCDKAMSEFLLSSQHYGKLEQLFTKRLEWSLRSA